MAIIVSLANDDVWCLISISTLWRLFPIKNSPPPSCPATLILILKYFTSSHQSHHLNNALAMSKTTSPKRTVVIGVLGTLVPSYI
jgi:hypothetical protein